MQAGTCELELAGREARLDDATAQRFSQDPTQSVRASLRQSSLVCVQRIVHSAHSQLFSVGASQVPVVVVVFGRSCRSFHRGG
ncbi:hypothetical protein RB213_015625 [Colletotrichum asianum]